MKSGNKLRIGVTDLLLAALCAALFVGTRSWFAVCDTVMEGGDYMSCHWAGEALKAVALLALALSVVHALAPGDGIKLGLDLSLAGVAVLAMRMPGGIISICAGEAMACRLRTHPWTVALSAALLVLCLADTVVRLAAASRARHARENARR